MEAEKSHTEFALIVSGDALIHAMKNNTISNKVFF